MNRWPQSSKDVTKSVFKLSFNHTFFVFRLGDINLRQYDCQDSDMDVLDVIYTPKQENSSNYLFTVSCTIADKSSPEFSTKYNSTEQLVVANFEVLQIVLHQECLQRIMEVVNNFQRNLDLVLSSTRPRDRMGSIGGGDGIKRTLNVILEDTEEIMTTDQMKRRKKTRRTHVVETVKVRVIANLDQVGLVLTGRNRPIAEMNVKKFVSSLIIKSSYTEVNIGLKDIQVLDLNPYTIHKNVSSLIVRGPELKNVFYSSDSEYCWQGRFQLPDCDLQQGGDPRLQL